MALLQMLFFQTLIASGLSITFLFSLFRSLPDPCFPTSLFHCFVQPFLRSDAHVGSRIIVSPITENAMQYNIRFLFSSAMTLVSYTQRKLYIRTSDDGKLFVSRTGSTCQWIISEVGTWDRSLPEDSLKCGAFMSDACRKKETSVRRLSVSGGSSRMSIAYPMYALPGSSNTL